MQENLSLYHIFYATGRTGNISQAARELYISQPAISHAIKKLEQNLDTVLFKRNSRGVELTADGQLLYEKVKEAFSLLGEGEESQGCGLEPAPPCVNTYLCPIFKTTSL